MPSQRNAEEIDDRNLPAGPSDDEILEACNKALDRYKNHAPCDEMRIDKGLVMWLVHRVEMCGCES